MDHIVFDERDDQPRASMTASYYDSGRASPPLKVRHSSSSNNSSNASANGNEPAASTTKTSLPQTIYLLKEHGSSESLVTLTRRRRKRRGSQTQAPPLAQPPQTEIRDDDCPSDASFATPPCPTVSTTTTIPPPPAGSPLRLAAYQIRQRLRKTRPLSSPRQPSTWLIPANHPLKQCWDVATFFLSFVAAYVTHTAIRDRSFGSSYFGRFVEIWFLVDILLNFLCQHKTSDGLVLRDSKQVWARYLTTWFVIDILSLFPWESLYIKPIIEMQNRRNFAKKSFFRTRAVIRVTRFLRGRHFRYFGKLAKQTKTVGVGANRLLRLLIKYVPKYLLFYRNMRGVLAVRTLRQVHWLRKVIRNFWVKEKPEEDTILLEEEEEDEEYDYWEVSSEDDLLEEEEDGDVVILYDKDLVWEQDEDDDDEDGDPF